MPNASGCLQATMNNQSGIDFSNAKEYNKTMKRNQSAEDYLETILLLSKQLDYVHQVEVARSMGVSQPAVQKALKLLESRGYIKWDGLHIHLTDGGKIYAEEVYCKHCTIKKFLMLHGVNAEDADSDACEMEHGISKSTMDMMRAYVEENDK